MSLEQLLFIDKDLKEFSKTLHWILSTNTKAFIGTGCYKHRKNLEKLKAIFDSYLKYLETNKNETN